MEGRRGDDMQECFLSYRDNRNIFKMKTKRGTAFEFKGVFRQKTKQLVAYIYMYSFVRGNGCTSCVWECLCLVQPLTELSRSSGSLCKFPPVYLLFPSGPFTFIKQSHKALGCAWIFSLSWNSFNFICIFTSIRNTLDESVSFYRALMQLCCIFIFTLHSVWTHSKCASPPFEG